MASGKRQLENAEDSASPVKRGRGRPRKDPNAPPPPPKDPNAPKRGRGRPRKNPDAPVTPKPPKVPGRGRGRPRKDAGSSANTPATPKSPQTQTPGRGRGRPRKDADESATPAESTPAEKSSSAAKRGRPKKEDSDNSVVLKLSHLIGTYNVYCEQVDEKWPDLAEEMSMSISPIPHTKACLIASFNLGVLEGTMLLAASTDTVDRVHNEMDVDESDEKSEKKSDKAADPKIQDGTIYYTWRGRDTGSDTNAVYPGKTGYQVGTFKFNSDSKSFQAFGDFPTLGDQCEFTGSRTSDEPEEEPEPWTTFREEAD